MTEGQFLPGPLLVLSKPGANFPFEMLVPWPCCSLGPRPPKDTLLTEQIAEESESSEQISYKTNVLTTVKSSSNAVMLVLYVRLCVCAQSCQTLCDPMGYSPPGSFAHGIFQARILEWAAISYSRGSS